MFDEDVLVMGWIETGKNKAKIISDFFSFAFKTHQSAFKPHLSHQLALNFV